MLASGGGSADRHVRFWNCYTGTMINAIDTKSQVGVASVLMSLYKITVPGSRIHVLAVRYEAMLSKENLCTIIAGVCNLQPAEAVSILNGKLGF